MQRWLLNFPGTISLPDPLERMGQESRLGITDAVTGIAAKQVLILITFGLEYLGHLRLSGAAKQQERPSVEQESRRSRRRGCSE